MPKLPVVSGKETVRALEKREYSYVRTKGSHVILNKETEDGKITIPVPLHKELAKGTLKSILKQADLTVEEFIKLI